jgi:hypothetical protein
VDRKGGQTGDQAQATKIIMAKYILLGLFVGAILGWGAFTLMTPRYAPTNPRMMVGDKNQGRILGFNVQGYPGGNFIFKEDGHLPVIVFPSVAGDEPIPVTLLDGTVMSLEEFMNDFQTNTTDPYAHSIFQLDYQEDGVNELGYVMSLKEISK